MRLSAYLFPIFVVMGLSVLLPVCECSAQLYSVTSLGDLPDGSDFSFGTSINSFGQVTGYSSAASGERAFLWTPSVPNGTTGSMIDLGDLPDGTDRSHALGINDRGQVVGFGSAATGNRAFLWSPTVPNGTTGNMFDLGDLPDGNNSSGASAINNFGQVTGNGGAITGNRAFLWTPTAPNGTTGTMTDIGDLPNGSDNSSGTDINDLGQIIGSGVNEHGFRTFLWTPQTSNGASGSMVDIGDLPGGTSRSSPGAINASGQIAGHSNAATGDRAYLWTPDSPNGSTGTLIDLGDLPGGTDFSAFGVVNSTGTVVGASHVDAGSHVFFWTASTGILDLNNFLDASGAGWILQQAGGINDFGQIVGTGLYDPDGAGNLPAVTRAFLLTPVPEPGNIALLALAGMVLKSRRQRK